MKLDIYVRIKFKVVTLLFLAVWHGFHSGYYLVFFNEFLSIKVEREFLSIWSKSAKVERWSSTPMGSRLISMLGMSYVFFFLPHCLLPFVLLTYNKFLPSYLSMYGCLYVIYFSWPLWKGMVKKFLFDENVIVKETVKKVEHIIDNVKENVEFTKDETEKATESVTKEESAAVEKVTVAAVGDSKEGVAVADIAKAVDDKKNI